MPLSSACRVVALVRKSVLGVLRRVLTLPFTGARCSAQQTCCANSLADGNGWLNQLLIRGVLGKKLAWKDNNTVKS
jgi:hypothetical protein